MTDFDKFWDSIKLWTLWTTETASGRKALAETAFKAGQQSVWDHINNDINKKNKRLECSCVNDYGTRYNKDGKCPVHTLKK